MGDILRDIHVIVSRVDERTKGIQKRLTNVEANIDLQRDALREHGKSIALLRQECQSRKEQCQAKFKRISSEYHSMDDTTDVIHIAHLQSKAKWNLIKMIAAGIAASGATFAAIWRLFL